MLAPDAGGAELAIDVEGALAGLLRAATGQPLHPIMSGTNAKKASGGSRETFDDDSELVLVAGTGVDHNLRSTPVKMVAGGRNHLYLQASCNEASKVTAEEAVGEVQSFLTNLFQTAA